MNNKNADGLGTTFASNLHAILQEQRGAKLTIEPKTHGAPQQGMNDRFVYMCLIAEHLAKKHALAPNAIIGDVEKWDIPYPEEMRGKWENQLRETPADIDAPWLRLKKEFDQILEEEIVPKVGLESNRLEFQYLRRNVTGQVVYRDDDLGLLHIYPNDVISDPDDNFFILNSEARAQYKALDISHDGTLKKMPISVIPIDGKKILKDAKEGDSLQITVKRVGSIGVEKAVRIVLPIIEAETTEAEEDTVEINESAEIEPPIFTSEDTAGEWSKVQKKQKPRKPATTLSGHSVRVWDGPATIAKTLSDPANFAVHPKLDGRPTAVSLNWQIDVGLKYVPEKLQMLRAEDYEPCSIAALHKEIHACITEMAKIIKNSKSQIDDVTRKDLLPKLKTMFAKWGELDKSKHSLDRIGVKQLRDNLVEFYTEDFFGKAIKPREENDNKVRGAHATFISRALSFAAGQILNSYEFDHSTIPNTKLAAADVLIPPELLTDKKTNPDMLKMVSVLRGTTQRTRAINQVLRATNLKNNKRDIEEINGAYATVQLSWNGKSGVNEKYSAEIIVLALSGEAHLTDTALKEIRERLSHSKYGMPYDIHVAARIKESPPYSLVNDEIKDLTTTGTTKSSFIYSRINDAEFKIVCHLENIVQAVKEKIKQQIEQENPRLEVNKLNELVDGRLKTLRVHYDLASHYTPCLNCANAMLQSKKQSCDQLSLTTHNGVKILDEKDLANWDPDVEIIQRKNNIPLRRVFDGEQTSTKIVNMSYYCDVIQARRKAAFQLAEKYNANVKDIRFVNLAQNKNFSGEVARIQGEDGTWKLYTDERGLAYVKVAGPRGHLLFARALPIRLGIDIENPPQQITYPTTQQRREKKLESHR
ncbi:MAG: hypothetical protein V4568_14990 [Pseudomonadota bacterium]